MAAVIQQRYRLRHNGTKQSQCPSSQNTTTDSVLLVQSSYENGWVNATKTWHRDKQLKRKLLKASATALAVNFRKKNALAYRLTQNCKIRAKEQEKKPDKTHSFRPR